MSGYVTGWVLKHSDVKGAARMVLIVLADHASSDGTNAWPSVDTVQHEARLGARSTVQRALRDLEELGSIRKAGTAGRGQTNWTVLMDEGPHHAAPPGAASDQGGAASDAQGGPHHAAQTVLVNRPEEPPIAAARDCGDDVEEIWSHYVAVMKPRHTDLDAGGRALIRDALKVASAVECKGAINGCFASDVHMGRRGIGDSAPKKYNRLSQILKGKRGIRTLREQIDLFLDVAEKKGVGDGEASVDQARLAQAKRNVLTAWEMPRSEQAQRNGEMSAAWLAQHGYIVERAEGGRPTFRRER